MLLVSSLIRLPLTYLVHICLWSFLNVPHAFHVSNFFFQCFYVVILLEVWGLIYCTPPPLNGTLSSSLQNFLKLIVRGVSALYSKISRCINRPCACSKQCTMLLMLLELWKFFLGLLLWCMKLLVGSWWLYQ